MAAIICPVPIEHTCISNVINLSMRQHISVIKEGLLTPVAQRFASVLFGVRAFMPKFYRNRVIPYQNVDTIRYVVDRTTTLPLQVCTQ